MSGDRFVIGDLMSVSDKTDREGREGADGSRQGMHGKEQRPCGLREAHITQ